MKSYLVKREHIGDRPYRTGDTRRADPALVGHLVRSGVLAEAKGEAKRQDKAAPPPQNKAERTPQNKANQ
ncbi:hypothetical protein [Paracoccus alkanivorans]|uniref:Uncharacterized protein n=1 Tax=Paracoccus alkanivorans TaxID=2116655 RepID=A0A3M0MIK9_9RHOB|nr:hypothetical protein [Paracoccus alkanivorans]RMC37501.1 hypothetical protein C9E81_01750 [Paracoccus alkanivorans]